MDKLTDLVLKPANGGKGNAVMTRTASKISDSLSDEKVGLPGIPALESDQTFYQRGMPDSLKSMSSDEIKFLEKQLVRKLDLHIMPVVIVMFLLNIIDRNGLTNAKLGTLTKDLGLDSHEYQTALMLLYVGYLLFQVPSNMLLPYTRPSLYLPGCMALWVSSAPVRVPRTTTAVWWHAESRLVSSRLPSSAVLSISSRASTKSRSWSPVSPSSTVETRCPMASAVSLPLVSCKT